MNKIYNYMRTKIYTFIFILIGSTTSLFSQEKLLSLALIEAVPTGNAELIRLLIAAGADAQTADHTGIPASQLAADQPEIPAIPQPKPKQHL